MVRENSQCIDDGMGKEGEDEAEPHPVLFAARSQQTEMNTRNARESVSGNHHIEAVKVSSHSVEV